ncbi:MAG: Arm DNA-binding domain-containing protein [Pseudomonadota bacterium]
MLHPSARPIGGAVTRDKLTAFGIRNAPYVKHEDGTRLRLAQKGPGGYWVFRSSLRVRRREMGLGPYPTVSLAAARKWHTAQTRHSMVNRNGDLLVVTTVLNECPRARPVRRNHFRRDCSYPSQN